MKVFRAGFFLSFLLMTTLLPATSMAGNQLKKTIAVVDFSSKVSNFEGGAGFVEMLTNALFESNRFVVVDRAALWQVLDEQDFAASDRSANALKTAMTGKAVPAQLLIIGAITEWGEGSTDSKGGGLSYGGVSLNSSKSQARMGIIMRILDSSTGEVVESISVEGEAQASSKGGGVCFGGACLGGNSDAGETWAEVTEDVIRKAVDEIIVRTDEVPFEGKIIRLSGDTIYVNAGERNGVVNGDVFTVYSQGEELIDPDTGESLGSDMFKVGSIKLQGVSEKFSRAAAVTGNGFEPGLLIVPAIGSKSSWD